MRSDETLSLTIAAPVAAALRRDLFTDDGNENFGVLYCGAAQVDAHRRLLSREWQAAPSSAYVERLPYHLEISPRFFNSIVDHAARTQLNPVIVHSHPGATHAKYSPSDDFGESRLMPVLSQLLPGLTPASLLVTARELRGRVLRGAGFGQMTRIVVEGQPGERHEPDGPEGVRRRMNPAADHFDRQIRAIGDIGQRAIGSLKVAVVGLGGTGSAVAEQLVRVGLRSLDLIDPDLVELTNLPRLWGAYPADVGRKKVEVVRDHLVAICPSVRLRTRPDSVVRQSILDHLRDCDVIFACTDNHWSRAVLNRFAHQYLIPVIDMGVRLDARTGRVTAAAGQVALVGPGLSCLRCSRLIDPEQVRQESMPTVERERLTAEGYVQGSDAPEPSVISLNTTVAGIAVTAALSLFTNLLGAPHPPAIRYDASRGSVFPVDLRREADCDVCSATGVTGLGDAQRVSAYD